MIGKKITSLRAFETLDSRGDPTVTVHIALEGGAYGSASVPSGASTGKYEAAERRDGNKARYMGRGTKGVCAEIEQYLLPSLRHMDATCQRELDMRLCELDGTENKSRFGANALLAVSLAICRGAANAYEMPLYRYLGGLFGGKTPIPMMNILNGGKHADNNIDIQEFMIVPVGAPSAEEAIRMGSEIYHTLKGILRSRGLSTAVGDEGGFAPDLDDDEAAIELLLEAIVKAGYSDSVHIALDAAASEWSNDESYALPARNTVLTSDELIEKYAAWCKKYPIISLEDPLGENDRTGWRRITERLGKDVVLVGDDLFVTNTARICDGIREGLANAVLIKPNQIGTLTETMDAIRLARKNGYQTVISHRSGETCDTFISDLAVASGASFLKAGAPARGERVAKYNRLIMIETLLS